MLFFGITIGVSPSFILFIINWFPFHNAFLLITPIVVGYWLFWVTVLIASQYQNPADIIL